MWSVPSSAKSSLAIPFALSKITAPLLSPTHLAGLGKFYETPFSLIVATQCSYPPMGTPGMGVGTKECHSEATKLLAEHRRVQKSDHQKAAKQLQGVEQKSTAS